MKPLAYDVPLYSLTVVAAAAISSLGLGVSHQQSLVECQAFT